MGAGRGVIQLLYRPADILRVSHSLLQKPAARLTFSIRFQFPSSPPNSIKDCHLKWRIHYCTGFYPRVYYITPPVYEPQHPSPRRRTVYDHAAQYFLPHQNRDRRDIFRAESRTVFDEQEADVIVPSKSVIQEGRFKQFIHENEELPDSKTP